MSLYHILLEAYNVIWHCSSESIKSKWAKKSRSNYSLRNETKLGEGEYWGLDMPSASPGL